MASFSITPRKDEERRKEAANVGDEQTSFFQNFLTGGLRMFHWTVRPQGLVTLQRVPTQLRANKEHLYAPVFFPLGPYHHDKVRFRQAEQLKTEVLNIRLNENHKGKAHREFLERSQEIRNFYGGLSGYTYDDNALAEMMLRDACFLLYHMEATVNLSLQLNLLITSRLGLSGLMLMGRDVLMLENQVPLWAIKLLLRLTLFTDADDVENNVEEFLWKFITFGNKMISDDEISDQFVVEEVPPWGGPLHLLELSRSAAIKPRRSNGTNGSKNGFFHKIFKRLKWKSRSDPETSPTRMPDRLPAIPDGIKIPDRLPLPDRIPNHPARSVMDLKAKGIQICPSSICLTDIRFESYWLFGKLLLPTCFIDDGTKVYFSNVIALEMSPELMTNSAFISYVNFMQSLIESPKDVKELREKGVIKSFMNDEQVMNTFKELDIYGMDNFLLFNDVKIKIDSHCQSKAKTWMAELFHTYFRNPWSAIALFTAAILLCLTFLQTVYAKKSIK